MTDKEADEVMRLVDGLASAISGCPWNKRATEARCEIENRLRDCVYAARQEASITMALLKDLRQHYQIGPDSLAARIDAALND